MKKLCIIIVFTFSCLCSFATIHTVSNVDSSAQFNNIQAACDAGSSGDSIYVSASPNAYADFTIYEKKLAIFGPGWSPFVPGTANVQGCTIAGIYASGSELHGLVFSSTVSVVTSGINNLLFYRNKISTLIINYVAANNYIIEGNWFDNGSIQNSGGTASNFTIRNNIFYNSYIYYFSNCTNVVINHNLWYSSYSQGCFSSCSNLIISNNIFDRKDASGTSFSKFNNNITHNTSNDAPWNSNNNSNAGGNMAGVDPGMVDQTSVNGGVDNPLLNFTIPSGAANNSGSDGKDMGLLFDAGGVVNWNNCRASNFPYITQLNITDQTIFSNSYIHFNLQAKSN